MTYRRCIRSVDRPRWRECLESEATAFISLLVLVVLVKATVLDTPYYWDETLWIGFAHKLAALRLWQVLPGLHEPFLFGNRVPGLFLPMAALFTVTGPSIWVSHALILCFSFVGVWFTYRLASLWFGRLAGLLAALFLFLDATYFSQSAMFLADLPAAAVAVTAVYFGVRRRFPLYWACALYLVSLKEPAVAVVCALAAWAFVTRARSSFRAAISDAVRHAAPVPVIALYYVWQWLATGHPFVHYENEFEPFAADLDAALGRLPRIHRWLLIEQGRWVFSLLILAGLVRRSFRCRRELLLVALVLLFGGYSYAFLYFLPRYLLPMAPFFFALSAGALVALLRDKRLQLAAGALLVALLIARLEEQTPVGNRETNMGYLRVVRTHREACAFIEREFPGRSVRAGFPLSALLLRPQLGYVRDAVAVLPAAPGPVETQPPADLIVAGFPGGTDPLETYAQSLRLERLRRFGEGDLQVTIYAGSTAVTP